MIVGTASHAGKSILVTALCRLLTQRGVRVAPFKSQNMALNSFVCRDGSEIGRSQVVQAEAAGIEPEVDWFFLERSHESFNRLASKYDVILLEGAGSAAEVNLKDRDIVNLPFAQAVGAPALLVADIDRGGVFASIVGTFALMTESERALLRGFVINRFRGDPKLFADGPQFLENHTGRPCLGVLPYNTIADLRWLQEQGFKPMLLDILDRGGWIVGVCGGYQMLGRTVSDPLDAEEGEMQKGLDLLPVETELDVHKVTVQSKGRSFLGPEIDGYEMHLGRTTCLRPVDCFVTKADGKSDGAVVGRVGGTYFHGLFDNAEFTSAFLTQVAESRRSDWRPGPSGYSKEREYNRLAATVGEHLNTDRIWELVGSA